MGDTAATAVLLADQTRVRIIDALRVGPLRTVELAGVTGMSAAALSRHLNLLREAGLVERFDVAGDGRGRSYRLQPAALDGLAGWIRSTAWSAELAAGSTQPKTQELLANIGGFLDAFAANNVKISFRRICDPTRSWCFLGWRLSANRPASTRCDPTLRTVATSSSTNRRSNPSEQRPR